MPVGATLYDCSSSPPARTSAGDYGYVFRVSTLNTQQSDAEFELPPYRRPEPDIEDFASDLVMPDFGAGIWYSTLERFLAAWSKLPGDTFDGVRELHPEDLSKPELAELRKEHRALHEEFCTATE